MTHLRGLMLGSLAALMLATVAATPAEAGLRHHSKKKCCEPAPVCCPAPPVQVQWCVTDPCNGCSYQVSACVPACCADSLPEMAKCRNGIFGRKILTYRFACCGHCVDVVVTKHGRTIVRD